MAFKKGDWSLGAWTKPYGFNEPRDGSLKSNLSACAQMRTETETLDVYIITMSEVTFRTEGSALFSRGVIRALRDHSSSVLLFFGIH